MEVMDVLEVEESARTRLNRAGVAVPDLWLSRVVRWFPVSIVLSVIAWSYLTIVLAELAEVDGWPGAGAMLRMVLFHALTTLMMWCFFATMVTPPGAPEQEEWGIR